MCCTVVRFRTAILLQDMASLNCVPLFQRCPNICSSAFATKNTCSCRSAFATKKYLLKEVKIELSNNYWTAPFKTTAIRNVGKLLWNLTAFPINIHHHGNRSHVNVLIYFANPFVPLPKALNTLLNQEAFQYLFLHVSLLLLIALHVYQ